MTRAYHADHLAVEYLEGKYRVAWVWLLELLPGKLFQDRMHLEHGRLTSDEGIERGQPVRHCHAPLGARPLTSSAQQCF